MALNASGRKALIVTFLVVVGVAAIAWQVIKSIPQARYYTLEGAIITAIDPPARTAEIEFIHPRSGRVQRLKGTLAPGGEITLDGAPATIDDLRVGDTVTVGGMVGRDLNVAADKVLATRPARYTDTAPASRPTTPTMKAVEP
jgi:hypothetical protein